MPQALGHISIACSGGGAAGGGATPLPLSAAGNSVTSRSITMTRCFWYLDIDGFPLERIDALTGEHVPVLCGRPEELASPGDSSRTVACSFPAVLGMEWVWRGCVGDVEGKAGPASVVDQPCGPPEGVEAMLQSSASSSGSTEPATSRHWRRCPRASFDNRELSRQPWP